MKMTIEIKNIDFAYKKELVLRNVSTTIKHGDFVAFVGPNGSGKSTLIRCIDGILKPQKGNIYINGKDIHKLNRNAIARMIAYVPQSDGGNLSTLVYDTVLMGRKPYVGWKPDNKDHATVIRVLKMLNLESIAMKNINELSGGQKQRVFIARALAQEPGIILLDEPTANLDLKHSLEVLNILKELTEKDITVIIAIHDLNLAVRYCNHITMLNGGEIFAEGGKDILTTENIHKLYGVDVKLINDGNHILFVPN
jgi:iron complex transport system ATP-binding protein